MTRAVKPRRFAIRPIIYASVLSAGVLLCAFSAHADERDQLKSIQADIAAKERAVPADIQRRMKEEQRRQRDTEPFMRRTRQLCLAHHEQKEDKHCGIRHRLCNAFP